MIALEATRLSCGLPSQCSVDRGYNHCLWSFLNSARDTLIAVRILDLYSCPTSAQVDDPRGWSPFASRSAQRSRSGTEVFSQGVAAGQHRLPRAASLDDLRA
jgi:hypothetical protein